MYNMSNTTYIEQNVLGNVKWFNNKTGYGFVTVVSESSHKGKDIFAHYSNLKLEKSQYRYLVQGEYIQFDLVKPEKGTHEFHAVNITGVCNGPIMCQVKQLQMEERNIKKTDDGEGSGAWKTN
jgi:cold shock CspA family protein